MTDQTTNQRQKAASFRYIDETVDAVIVGAGATGPIYARELSHSGLKIVLLDAGPFWDVGRDFVSDELHMNSKTAWSETRIVSGANPPKLGHNTSGWGMGGSTLHFTAVLLRFFPSDFRVYSEDGVADNWPITYEELEPYYEEVEKDLAVSGPKSYPWGPDRGAYPFPERNPISANAEVFRRGCERLGIPSVITPLGILSAAYNGRPPCINRGFCAQGCLPNAKFSSLIHHIPQAMESGTEARSESVATGIETDDSGLAAGVTFLYQGQEYFQRAKCVILAASAIETPRLLLLSANPQWPDGLANSSGLVGKRFMVHSGHDVFARFPSEIRLYKGTPIMASTQEFAVTSSENDFVRGYTLHAHGARPLGFIKPIAESAGLWGEKLREVARDYNFFAQVTMVGEVLPQYNNSVTLSSVKDRYGLPAPKVTFSYGENDQKLISHGVNQMARIMESAGGVLEYVCEDTSHIMGTCRMGDDPSNSVTDKWGQCHDVPNLFVGDTSLFVTSGGANPTLTAMALAYRNARYIREKFKNGDL